MCNSCGQSVEEGRLHYCPQHQCRITRARAEAKKIFLHLWLTDLFTMAEYRFGPLFHRDFPNWETRELRVHGMPA